MKKFPGRFFSLKLLYVRSNTSRTGNAPKPRGSTSNRFILPKVKPPISFYIAADRFQAHTKHTLMLRKLTLRSRSSTLAFATRRWAARWCGCWRDSVSPDWLDSRGPAARLYRKQRDESIVNYYSTNLSLVILLPWILLWLNVNLVILIMFTETQQRKREFVKIYYCTTFTLCSVLFRKIHNF